MITSFNDSDRQ